MKNDIFKDFGNLIEKQKRVNIFPARRDSHIRRQLDVSISLLLEKKKKQPTLIIYAGRPVFVANLLD